MSFLDTTACLMDVNPPKEREQPRICLLTTREFATNAFRCGFYEGEDVLVEIDAVDLIIIDAKKNYETRQSVHEILIWQDITQKAMTYNLTCKPVRLTKEYDLFIAYLPHCQDIIHVPAIQNWKAHCKTSICWINELWLEEVYHGKFIDKWLPALAQFDYLASGLDATAKTLSQLLNRRCDFIPCGVDTLRFNPYIVPTGKVIDIYNMGRTWPELHLHLLDIANKHNLFYLYDTYRNTGGALVKHYQQHRIMLSNLLKRSKYFIVAPAKMDMQNAIGKQIEVGARYFEAAAAGAVLLGQSPDCEAFRQLFAWPDVVVEIEPNGSDVQDVLAMLGNQPEKIMAISQRNAIESLLQHDWLYRWKQVLNMVGLKPLPQLQQREKMLTALAENITSRLALEA